MQEVHRCAACRLECISEEELFNHKCSKWLPKEDEVETKLGNPYGGGDAAIAIGEDAFKAGFKACEDYFINGLGFHHDRDLTAQMEGAWSNYDPPEDIKAMA